MKITNIKVRIAVISTNQKWLVLISLNLVLVNPWDLETLKSIVARSHHSGRSSPNFNPTYFSEPWTFFIILSMCYFYYWWFCSYILLLVILFLHTLLLLVLFLCTLLLVVLLWLCPQLLVVLLLCVLLLLVLQRVSCTYMPCRKIYSTCCPDNEVLEVLDYIGFYMLEHTNNGYCCIEVVIR